MPVKKQKPVPVLSLLRDEAKRVFGKDYYLMTTRTVPWKVMVGNDKVEVSVFNLNDENTIEVVYEQTLACLKGLPDKCPDEAQKPKKKPETRQARSRAN